MNQYLNAATNRDILVPTIIQKDEKSRLLKYTSWLDTTSQVWYKPDFVAYGAHLSETGLSTNSITAHLSTVRSRYRQLLTDYKILQMLTIPTIRDLTSKILMSRRTGSSKQVEVPNSAKTWTALSVEEANMLVTAPAITTLDGLRDSAMISLMLCTGIREAELCALNVSDLHHSVNGEPALYICNQTTHKDRLIPYGAHQSALALTEAWLRSATITEGAVFHSFWKGGKRLRGRLSVRSVQNILHKYPVLVKGRLQTVTAHELRITYARHLFETGVSLNLIQKNLGHQTVNAVIQYVSKSGTEALLSSTIYQIPKLAELPRDKLKNIVQVHSEIKTERLTRHDLPTDGLRLTETNRADLFAFCEAAYQNRYGRHWRLQGGQITRHGTKFRIWYPTDSSSVNNYIECADRNWLEHQLLYIINEAGDLKMNLH